MNLAIWLEAFVALVGAWLMLSVLWRDYRVDAFRHRLFSVRGQLTLMVAAGRLDKDELPYQFLRTSINGMIHRADHFNFFTLLLSINCRKPVAHSPAEQWRRSVNKLPEQTRRDLIALHCEVCRAFGIYVISGSIIMISITAFLMVKQQLYLKAANLRVAIEEAAEKAKFRQYEDEAYRAAQIEGVMCAA